MSKTVGVLKKQWEAAEANALGLVKWAADARKSFDAAEAELKRANAANNSAWEKADEALVAYRYAARKENQP